MPNQAEAQHADVVTEMKTQLFVHAGWRPCLVGLVALSGLTLAAAPVGIFEGQSDVGTPARAGSAVSRSATEYVVTGGGANMWATNDAFHFVWKRVSGDVRLRADMTWLRAGGNAHRKACLLIRQSLEPGAPYVDAVLHGNGLTSLQFRDTPGGLTHEVQANVTAPRRLQIERAGDFFFLSLAGPDQPFRASGCTYHLKLHDPVYVGLGVCAHDDQRLETARFANVELRVRPRTQSTHLRLESTLEIVPIASKDRRVVYSAWDHFEAPNWSRDGSYLLFNRHGRLYRLPVAGGVPQVINTGFATNCNNDHGFSPDGRQIALSDSSQRHTSLVYVVSASGGEPRRLTEQGPSYFHGWSPDGSTLAYCAERHGEFDVYTIPASGGTERRLTTAPGLDDGPDYSPDGHWIYFNSVRTGRMQIWRMRPDGSDQQQITHDGYNNWFAHPSPNGKWIVFLTYAPDVTGHPANHEVRLRLMPVHGGQPEVLARLFGGQGTINVPSWSPDSRNVAFVSYALKPAKE